ncbi:hypothetical protein HKD37_06G014967 [Glycine soja]
MQVPPIKAEGALVSGRAAISWSSNSMTVGWTPMVARSFFMTWHMQQEDRVKMMTGCSDINRWILLSGDSSSSMDSEEEELLIVGLSSSCPTTSFWKQPMPMPMPCIPSSVLFILCCCWCSRRKRVCVTQGKWNRV